MSEEAKNPNWIMALPKDVYVVPRTPKSEMLTSGWERAKFQNEMGEEFLEISNHRYASDQMLTVSLLAGKPGQEPIIPCSAIVANRTLPGVWRYFSHRTKLDDMATMTIPKALACELFFYYVFADSDHSILGKDNVQIMYEDDNMVHLAFHDFHKVAHFWDHRGDCLITTARLDEVLRRYNSRMAMNIKRDEVVAALRPILSAFDDLLKGDEGSAFVDDIFAYIPEEPEVIADLENTRAFRDALLERVHATQALFSR